MKEGDKVYCIKRVSMNHRYNNFIEGQFYKISSIFENTNKVYIQYTGHDGNKYISGFYIKESGGWHTFSDHFIDMNQIRKQKLEKLNQNGHNI